ncbi:MAG: thymidine phosphorylase [Thermoanaerobacterales bacterium]|nr:thymidine phosphorylase [Thermoanaerobacterales bacterium]
MRMYDLILKKRNGEALTAEEIRYLIDGYVREEIPDYQVAAWLMAVWFKGMDVREMADLTAAIVDSGERADLSGIPGIKLDKHSTGGVGDKTTLVVAPLVAAAGGTVVKMSGRGLGHTGGTIDKLESIPGFRTALSPEEMVSQARAVRLAIVAQTGNLTPADKKLYALRDVTATVDSVPLIAASVMSKKIASGANAVVLDVKAGSGAFMRQAEDALELARAMVGIGQSQGLAVTALITNMDQPLGRAVGNALEVAEALAVLRGEGPADLRELCLLVASHMLVLGRLAPDTGRACETLEGLLAGGKALARFREWVAAQGGDVSIVDDPGRLPRARRRIEVPSPAAGFVQAIDAAAVGRAAMLLGAGRLTKEASIDPAVGVVLRKKIGDPVDAYEALAVMHVNDPVRPGEAAAALKNAYRIGDTRPGPQRMLYHVVGESGQGGGAGPRDLR